MQPTEVPEHSRDHAGERVAPASAWKTLAVIAIAVLVVVVANLAARQLLRRFPVNVGYYVIRHKWQLLDSQPKPVDWLLLGDSSCNQGVRPDVIFRLTGETALNLCTIADVLALSDAWMLDRYLARVGKPKRVVVVHVGDVWEREVDELKPSVLAQIPLPFGYWRTLEPEVAFDRRSEWDAWLAHYVPLYAENTSLALVLQNPGRLRVPPPAIDEHGYMRKVNGDRAAVLADQEKEKARVRSGGGRISAPNRAALERLVVLADRHGLELTVVSAPLLDTLWEDRVFRERHARVTAELARRLASSKHVTLVESAPVLFPASELDNSVDHVLHDAAASYTAKIVEMVRKPAGAGR